MKAVSHYDEEKHRRSSYQNLIQINRIKSGVAADDGVAVHYVNQDIKEIVSSRPNAKAFKVYLENEIKEEILPTRYLGIQ